MAASDVLFYRTKNREEAGERLIKLRKTNDPHMTSRRLLAAKYGSLYEGLCTTSLAPFGYATDSAAYFQRDDDRIPVIRNACHSIVDTAVSKLAAMTQPRPSIMTTGADWALRRQAKRAEELVLPEYDEPQGFHNNLDELYQHALRLALAATGSAAIKVCVYNGETKITHELHDTLTMFFDFGELTYGGLLTLGEGTWFDVDALVTLHPEYEKIIRASAEKPPDEFGAPTSGQYERTEMVLLHEGWRATVGEETGVYCSAVTGGTLELKPYDYHRPPFVWLVPDPHLYGVLGHSMTHFMFESVKRDNQILAMIDRSVSKAVRGMTFVDRDQLDDPNAMDSVQDNDVIGVKGNYKPDHVNEKGFDEGHLRIADRHHEDAHEETGMSRMHTASVREEGLPSAQAQRQVAAQVNERFAACQRKYVRGLAIEDTRLMIRALKQIHDEHGKFSREWPGSKFLSEVNSDVLDLPSNKYSVKFGAVSGKTSSPEGRAQVAFELTQLGVLSKEGFASLQQHGFDVEAETDDANVEREWLEKQMFRWAYEDEETADDPDFYQSPIKFMNLEAALSVVVKGFVQGMLDELEDDRLEFFLMFISDLSASFKAKAEFVAATTPGGPTPGAPPALPGGGPPVAPPSPQ